MRFKKVLFLALVSAAVCVPRGKTGTHPNWDVSPSEGDVPRFSNTLAVKSSLDISRALSEKLKRRHSELGRVLNALAILRGRGNKVTLLAVCPMSKDIIQATIEVAKENGSIPMLIATPRQIDVARALPYTGWDQATFVQLVNEIKNEVGYNGPLFIARDHGGPWQRDQDKKAKLPLDEAMANAKETFKQDVEWGFNVIHVDPTIDPHVGKLSIEEVVKRTADLIEYIERTRNELGKAPVAYEVGTEEIEGGLTEPQDFERYIQLLYQEFERRNISFEDAWPVFIVGQTGTALELEGVGEFNTERAKRLVEIAAKYNMGLKQHSTDDMATDLLEVFPEIGTAAANVGPEFAGAEMRALAALEILERKGLEELGKLQEASNAMAVIEDQTIKSGRWKKWVPGKEAQDLSGDERRKVAIICARYVQLNPDVIAARAKLYGNLRLYGIVPDPERYVIGKIKSAIMRYERAFNTRYSASLIAELQYREATLTQNSLTQSRPLGASI